MSKVIAVSNQKGGVGKTVSCVNLGIGLAKEGKRVLTVWNLFLQIRLRILIMMVVFHGTIRTGQRALLRKMSGRTTI